MINFHVDYNTTKGLYTIQSYARRQLKMSLTAWRKFKHTGSIMLNGTIASPGDIVRPDDTLSFDYPIINRLEPANGLLDIIYEDHSLIVINKPPGLLVHPTSNQQELTLANYVIGHYEKHLESHGFHPVHRLDRNTSGLILIAKNPYIHQQLSENPACHFIHSYLALVHGKLQGTGMIDAPISRKPSSIIERIISANGQSAITEYTVINTLPAATLVHLSLLTGRTHQIRVHMAHIGHPLLGDDLYGGSQDLMSRHALHSTIMTFLHPLLHTKINLKSPLPEDMRRAISILRYPKNI